MTIGNQPIEHTMSITNHWCVVPKTLFFLSTAKDSIFYQDRSLGFYWTCFFCSILAFFPTKTFAQFDAFDVILPSGHTSEVLAASISPGNQYCYTSEKSNKTILWEISTQQVIENFTPFFQPIDVAFVQDDTWLILCDSSHIYYYDIQERTFFDTVQIEGVPMSFLDRVDNQTIGIQHTDGNLFLYDVLSQNITKKFSLPNDLFKFYFDKEQKWIVGEAYDSYHSKTRLEFVDVETGEVRKVHETESLVNDIWFGNDGKILMTQIESNGRIIEIVDPIKGIVVSSFRQHEEFVLDTKISAQGDFVVSGGWDDYVYHWKVSDGSEIGRIRLAGNVAYDLDLSNTGRFVVMAHDESTVIYSLYSYQARMALTGSDQVFFSPKFSSDGRRFYFSSFILMYYFDLQSAQLDSLFSCPNEFTFFADYRFYPGEEFFLITSQENQYLLADTSGRQLGIFDEVPLMDPKNSGRSENSPATFYIKKASIKKVPDVDGVVEFKSPIWAKENAAEPLPRKNNTEKWEGLEGLSENSAIAAAPISGKLFSGNRKGQLSVWNKDNAEVPFKVINYQKDEISELCVSPDERWLASISRDKTIKLFDIHSLRPGLTIVPVDFGEGIIYLDEQNYYLASPQAAKRLKWNYNGDTYYFNQLDAWLNRPDKVIEMINPADTALQRILRKTHELRMRRLQANGVDSFNLRSTLPLVKLKNTDLPLVTLDATFKIQAAFAATEFPIKAIHLYHNDVPVYGRGGFKMPEKRPYSFEKEFDLRLLPGNNMITLVAEDESGAVSLERTIRIFNEAPDPPSNLYLFSIGVSNFKDTSLNLNYAAKDVQDLVDLFIENNQVYDSIVCHTFLNEAATAANFNKIRPILEKTKTTDQVLLFVASHGIVDENLDYFIATHETNCNSSPPNYGVQYAKLEALLDHIPARRKLLVIDACHAGEIDEATIERVKQKNTVKGKLKIRSLEDLPVPKSLDEDNTMALMKSLFFDVRRGTGTTVLASSNGLEFALEGEEWTNGIFTYCIKRGLLDGLADLDHDEKIMVSELQKYLNRAVREITKDTQQPTLRIENINNDWRIW